MESQPQNPELRINPDNFHPCISKVILFAGPYDKCSLLVILSIAISMYTEVVVLFLSFISDFDRVFVADCIDK